MGYIGWDVALEDRTPPHLELTQARSQRDRLAHIDALDLTDSARRIITVAPDVLDHALDSLDTVFDELQGLEDFALQHIVIAREELAQHLRVDVDVGDRIAHFMSEPSEQRPDGRHFL